jgi:magnesium-transporting ATPase (P-type)
MPDDVAPPGVSGPATELPGLSADEAARRLERYGPNRLPEPPMPGPVNIFFRQFLSPFIYILLIAAIASLLLSQIPNAVFIFAVLLLNASIGTAQEYSAQRTAAALRDMTRGEARVIRDGLPRRIDAEEVVVGDVILLSSGDKVAADVMLDTSFSLSIDESLMTGESTAVTKNAAADVPQDAPLADRFNQCFAGTIVTHGRGRGTVTAIARIA